jgi:hypothetical protein
VVLIHGFNQFVMGINDADGELVNTMEYRVREGAK